MASLLKFFSRSFALNVTSKTMKPPVYSCNRKLALFIIQENDDEDDIEEEFEEFSMIADEAAAEPYPGFRKEYMPRGDKVNYRINREAGKASRQKVFGSIDLINFKRQHKLLHLAFKPYKSNVSKEDDFVEVDGVRFKIKKKKRNSLRDTKDLKPIELDKSTWLERKNMRNNTNF